MSNRVFRALLVAIFVLLRNLGAAADASLDKASEARAYGVIAGYFVAFVHHIRWPAEDTLEVMRIGILGRDPFGTELDRALKERTVRGRRLEVVRGENGPELAGCQVVFLDRPSRQEIEAAVESFLGRPVLTVAFTPHVAESPAMVDLTMKDGTVRYRLSSRRIIEAGLTPSADLMRLALNRESR